ncbi:hypothetical protein C8J57DRAFT_1390446 [Mycena rebaudengoi]|nr:hypothetical protein C8J57DRAFT_1390446 [Mycena rebaudengoi]
MVAPSLGQLNTQCNLSGVVGDCSRFVNDFCTTVDPLTITPFNSISKCYNGPGNAFKCDFTVLNTLNATGTPNLTNCNTALTTAARSCSMGVSSLLLIPTMERADCPAVIDVFQRNLPRQVKNRVMEGL